MTAVVKVNPEAAVSDLDGPTSERIVLRAVQAVLADRGVVAGEFYVTLLDDSSITTLNRQWKGRDEPTDVLAFALHSAGEPPVGDVYIGIERAPEQASAQGEPVGRELARLAIHGILHVLGYDHPEEGRETSELWVHQERILREVDIA